MVKRLWDLCLKSNIDWGHKACKMWQWMVYVPDYFDYIPVVN